MNDNNTTVSELKDKIARFSEKRNWLTGENAKDLSMALVAEAVELMEIFKWCHSDCSDDVVNDSAKFTNLREEIADVFWYLIRICGHYGIDLTEAVIEKAEKNAVKYPAQK